jgi:aryl-phospho-beta-D-glucosidase BglC (GH1 family)
MKKLQTIAALLVSLSLAACGGSSTPEAGAPALTYATMAGSSAARPAPSTYPSYNTNPLPPDMTGMSSNAVQLAAKFKAGWNAGNTLEAIGGETAWGNPKITPQLIQTVKNAGFTAIRLPASWNQYADQRTGKISDVWLNRVKEVVQYCVDNGMYVIVNIHWDGGWLDENITSRQQAAVNAKQKAFWEQIATHLRDFDEHLMFAGSNEPPVDDATQMSILMSYHQTFVNAVRSTGGKNAYRVLIVQGPSTNIDKSYSLMNSMPTDSVANRLMAEVHYYDPSQFALLTQDASWGRMYYYWGAGYHSSTDTTRNAEWGEEAWAENQFSLVKQKFVDKGIPVILGEYGAIRRTSLTGDNLALHLNSRAYYINTITRRATAYGLKTFYWDEGSMGNHGFGLINRANNTVGDPQALDALMRGANGLP